jgi:hypothetical protein
VTPEAYRPRVIKRISILVILFTTLAACASPDTEDVAAAAAGVPKGVAMPAAEVVAHPESAWEVRTLNAAPARFRPGGWSTETVLWGILGGRVASVNVATGEVRALKAEAWSVAAAHGVVSWRNDDGTWVLRAGSQPVRVAGGEHPSGFEGPPGLVWSPDGDRAILVRGAEWDSRHDLLERDGTIRELETSIPGYFLNDAALWLDSAHVLFRTVAMGPVGGEPDYRESGWRGDLAVLALGTGDYRLVTHVPDHTYLGVGGVIPGGILVTTWTTDRTRSGRADGGHAVYEAGTWEQNPIVLPAGRAFGSAAGAIIVLVEPDSAEEGIDLVEAVLIAAGETIPLGLTAMDAEPVFSPAGRRAALRMADGRLLLMLATP